MICLESFFPIAVARHNWTVVLSVACELNTGPGEGGIVSFMYALFLAWRQGTTIRYGRRGALCVESGDQISALVTARY